MKDVPEPDYAALKDDYGRSVIGGSFKQGQRFVIAVYLVFKTERKSAYRVGMANVYIV